jgi:hypothetical protein
MSFLQLLLFAVETIAQLAVNPALGLNGDGRRIAALLGVVAQFGRRGEEAAAELKAFTDEIKALADSGDPVDPVRWDEITAKRHADHAALAALRDEPEG